MKPKGTRMDRAAAISRIRGVLVDLLRSQVVKQELDAWNAGMERPLNKGRDPSLPTDPQECDLRELLRVLARNRRYEPISHVAVSLFEILKGHSHEKPISKENFEQAMDCAKHICLFFGSDAALEKLSQIEALPSADTTRVLVAKHDRSMADHVQLTDKIGQLDRTVASLKRQRADLASQNAAMAAEVAESSELNTQYEKHIHEGNVLIGLLSQRIQELERERQELRSAPTYAKLMGNIGHKMLDDIGWVCTTAGAKYLETFPLSEEKAAAYEMVLHQEYVQADCVRSFVLRQVQPILGLDRHSTTNAVQDGGVA